MAVSAIEKRHLKAITKFVINLIPLLNHITVKNPRRLSQRGKIKRYILYLSKTYRIYTSIRYETFAARSKVLKFIINRLFRVARQLSNKSSFVEPKKCKHLLFSK